MINLTGMHSEDDGNSDAALHLYYRGRDLMDSGQLADAIEAFRQASQMNPHYMTLQCLGECLARLGRLTDAIVPLAAATGLCNQFKAPTLLAEVFLALGKLTAAKQAADTAISRNSKYGRAIAVCEKINAAIVERGRTLGLP